MAPHVLSIMLLFVAAVFAGTSPFYPTSISDISSTHSGQPMSVLAVKDQSGAQNDWNSYIEFDSVAAVYSGNFVFSIGPANVTGLSLQLNFLGQPGTDQLWTFSLHLNAKGATPASLLKIGDTSGVTSGWGGWTLLTFNVPANTDFTRVLSASNTLQIRMTSSAKYDNCDIDFVQLTVTSSASTTFPTTTPTPTTIPPTTRPTTPPTTRPTTPPTPTPRPPTPTPTPTSRPPTPAPPAPTPTPTTAPGTKGCILKYLILSGSETTAGVDVAILAFNSTGIPYDFVAVSSKTVLNLPTNVTTGPYAGIVTSYLTLSSAQQAAVVAYQIAFGVKWVLFGSHPAGLPGLGAGTPVTTAGKLTLAPQFAQYANCLQPSISVDSSAVINWSGYGPAAVDAATITNSNIATPAIMIKVGSGAAQVAAAQIKNTDGTLQLHYFVDQVAEYHHSRAFAPLMVNWLSPGGIFIGARRIALLVQADDFFMASFLWNPATHVNAFSRDYEYRMTVSDLDQCVSFYEGLTAQLPAGSYVTVEWPLNGAGTLWYINPDPLLARAIQLQNKFWFLSHTYTHPCDLDTGTYAHMNTELVDNINFVPQLLTGGLASPRYSNDSMVTPCVTGLLNGQTLKAMVDNGIVNSVGDNSVAALKPTHMFHGIPSTVEYNGYAGVFIVPRHGLDIFYDCSLPVEEVDEYNHMYGTTKTFEQIMDTQVNYGMQYLLAFQLDPFMMHQANARFFPYDDPVTGINGRSVSLMTLWTERVAKKLASIFNLPIVTPRMSDLSKMWRQRLAQDTCGFQAAAQFSNGKVVALVVTSTSSCVAGISGVALSGPTVRVERVGVETTSWITMTAGVPQTLSLATPVTI